MKMMLMSCFLVLTFGRCRNSDIIEESKIFLPRYNRHIEDLEALGCKIIESDDGYTLGKMINDSTNIEFEVLANEDVIQREIWIIRFGRYDLRVLTNFVENNTCSIITSLCEESQTVVDLAGEPVIMDSDVLRTFSFFVRNNLTDRFFECRLDEERSGKALLTVKHAYPASYRDENNKYWKEH